MRLVGLFDLRLIRALFLGCWFCDAGTSQVLATRLCPTGPRPRSLALSGAHAALIPTHTSNLDGFDLVGDAAFVVEVRHHRDKDWVNRMIIPYMVRTRMPELIAQ